MKARSFLISAVFIGGSVGFAYAGPISQVSSPAGLFGTPISDTQTGPYCSNPGYKIPIDQYHMQLNTGLPEPKYHMGEDWNGKCGENTDEGYPLHALADGKVVFLDHDSVSGKGKRLYIRYSFPYAGASGDVATFNSAYLHMQNINGGLTWSQGVPGSGSNVTKGQNVGSLGKTGTTLAHLHWEAHWDDVIGVDDNPYKNPLEIDHALKYRAPSLIVDDRRDLRGYSVPADGRWYYFIMQGNAPSSTMYIMRNGQRKSLKNAIAAGWIPSQGIRHEINGSWYYYTDVDINFFENGKKYAINALVSGISQYILIPRNGFQEDRARLDILHAVEHNTGYVSVKTETYGHDPNWTSDFELHQMKFQLSTNQTVYVYQATYKTNPLIRFTNHYDTATKQPTGWVPIDWNRLY